MKFTVLMFALAVLPVPAHAQNTAQLSQLGLQGTLGNFGSAPTPRDQYGNPIPAPAPSDAERKAASEAEAARAVKIRAEEMERQAAAERLAADERRAAEQLAEEKRFHDQIMTAVYIGLAILAALVVSVVLRRSR